LEDPDPRTIRQAIEGDARAFEAIVRALETPVFRYLRGMLRDADLAEEVTQDTFLRCHRHLGAYEFRARFSTWVFRIAHNAGIDAVRARDRRLRLVDAAPQPAAATDPAARHELQAALEALSPKLRDALLAVEVLGLRYREAADVLGVPEGTVKSRVFQARERLVVWLRAEEGGSDAVP
jgi:RNA polymerase sigma-70 factor (ECF subfamily)